jgi:prevent-host-death family protein
LEEDKMREVGASEAENKLASLLDEVERGGEVIITRRGKPVAKLVPARMESSRRRAADAAARILARSKGVKLGGLKIKDLVDEGRP